MNLVTIRQKTTETIKLENSQNFFIFKINFKVMKTITNQLKYPIGLQLLMLLKKGIKNSWYNFFAVTKEQQTDNKLKIN